MTKAISARPHKPIIGIALIIVCSLHCLQAIISGAPIWTEAFEDGWIGAFRTPEQPQGKPGTFGVPQ